MKVLLRLARRVLLAIFLLLALSASTIAPYSGSQRVRNITRPAEFDYASWMVSALLEKNAFSTLDVQRYLTVEQQRQVVDSYLSVVAESIRVERRIAAIYSDPEEANPDQAAADLLEYQSELQSLQDRWGKLAETVIQHQVSVVLGEVGLSAGGQPIPPPLYRVTSLPLALIVSPREVIRQDADISLQPDLSLDEISDLEQQTEEQLDVSALVVPVGGVGVYPTMVMRTTNLPWLAETVAHEWAHNYLTLRPLGVLYYKDSPLRTMNETTASIVGQEVGRRVLERFYPDLAPPPPAPPSEETRPVPTPEPDPNAFNFQSEMHETRVTADRLLAEGKIEEAEAYMEARRVFFLDHGYQIRRLNQAYFAFYGAYANAPTGAFGEDPVGPRVRALREKSGSLADFLAAIAWMTSYEDLVAAVGG